MNNEIFFLIDLENLTQKYPVDPNVSQQMLIANINKAQSFYIKPIIGNTKFNELLDYVKTNYTPTNEEYDNLLLNYIEPIIAWYCVAELMYSNAFKTKSNISDNNGSNAFDEVNKAARKFKSDADNYANLLKEYLVSLEVRPADGDVKLITNTSIYMGDTSAYDHKIYKNYDR
jgi:hypothetical protein